MKTALVLTTINVPRVLALYRAYGPDVHFFVVGDRKSDDLAITNFLIDIPNHSYYGIDLQHSQVNVSFSAAHADTRTALAEAVPRLRARFAAGGLALGQATVQQEPRSDTPSQRRGGGGGVAAVTAAAKTVEPVAIAVTGAPGLVDEYA